VRLPALQPPPLPDKAGLSLGKCPGCDSAVLDSDEVFIDGARQSWHAICGRAVLALFTSKAGRPKQRRGQLALQEVIKNGSAAGVGVVVGGGPVGGAGAADDEARKEPALLPEGGGAVQG
jgi:hypothetical protein